MCYIYIYIYKFFFFLIIFVYLIYLKFLNFIIEYYSNFLKGYFYKLLLF